MSLIVRFVDKDGVFRMRTFQTEDLRETISNYTHYVDLICVIYLGSGETLSY